MPKIITDEDFKNTIKKLTNDEYYTNNKYVNIHEKIFFTHRSCGKTFYMAPNEFVHKGYRCPYCTGKLKINTDVFKKRVYDAVKDEYSVLGEYVNSREKIRIKHNTCGNTYYVTPTKFLSENRRCPECSKNRTMSFSELINAFKEKNNEYIPTTDYSYMNKQSTFIHTLCGKTFSAIPRNLLDKKYSCPYCKNNLSIIEENFKIKIKKFGYKLISKFSKKGKMLFLCSKCGDKFYSTFDDICSQSCFKCHSKFIKGKIVAQLISQGHTVETEKVFNGKYPCGAFDIFIKDLNLIIEFYDRYHYYDNIIDGTKLEEVKHQDLLKKKNIQIFKRKAIIIPFWEVQNIDEILLLLNDILSKETSFTSFEIFRRDLKLESFSSYKKRIKVSKQ